MRSSSLCASEPIKEGDGSLVAQGAIEATNPLTEKAATTMLPARPPRNDEPRRPGEEFLTTKSLLLLIIAGGIAELYVRSPHIGIAVVAAITVLALLWKMIS